MTMFHLSEMPLSNGAFLSRAGLQKRLMSAWCLATPPDQRSCGEPVLPTATVHDLRDGTSSCGCENGNRVNHIVKGTIVCLLCPLLLISDEPNMWIRSAPMGRMFPAVLQAHRYLKLGRAQQALLADEYVKRRYGLA